MIPPFQAYKECQFLYGKDYTTEKCPGSFWAYIVGQDRSDSKSNRLHVDIFQFYFHSFEVYSIDSSKMISNFSEVSNFNR